MAKTQSPVYSIYIAEIKAVTNLPDVLVASATAYIPNEYFVLIDSDRRINNYNEYRYYPIIDRMTYIGRCRPNPLFDITDNSGRKYKYGKGPGKDQISLARDDIKFIIDTGLASVSNPDESRQWAKPICQIIGSHIYFMTNRPVNYSLAPKSDLLTDGFVVKKYELASSQEVLIQKNKMPLQFYFGATDKCVMSSTSGGDLCIIEYRSVTQNLIITRYFTKTEISENIVVKFPYEKEVSNLEIFSHSCGLWLVVTTLRNDINNIRPQYKILYNLIINYESTIRSSHCTILSKTEHSAETVFSRDYYSDRIYIFTPGQKVKIGQGNTITGLDSDVPETERFPLWVAESVSDTWDVV